MVPKAWADQAAEVSGLYLILAFRLYRAWRMREPGTDMIAVTAKRSPVPAMATAAAGSDDDVSLLGWKRRD